MKVGDIIKHKKWKDLALEVVHVESLMDGWLVMGEYINMGFTSSWNLGIGMHSHVVLDNNKNSWQRMAEGTHSSIRYNKWVSL